MKIHYIQHVPFEDLGNIEKWAKTKSYSVSATLSYENQDFPDTDSFDLLVILGGPMNIYEEDKYSWLKKEKQFIKEAIKQNKYIIGICLGAQLLADTLGAKVYPNSQKEIGWFPINLTQHAVNSGILSGLPNILPVFHWHGDTFDLPKNSILLASSKACTNQAFVYNEKIIGLQFHLETSEISAGNLIKHCGNELNDSGCIQTPEQMMNDSNFAELETNLQIFLENLDKLIIKEKNYVQSKN